MKMKTILIIATTILICFSAAAAVAAPTTVGTTSAYCPVGYPNQRRNFYANGLYWVFYSDYSTSTYMLLKTSADGSTWSGSTQVRDLGTYGAAERFSVYFDGTYVHYAFGSYDTGLLTYRRGTPNANGTITWSAAEQTALSSGTDKYSYPTVCADANGYPFIGYVGYVGGSYYPYIIKSSTNDGTWSTAANFPYQLNTGTSIDWTATIVPLTASGQMYAVYTRNSGYALLGRHYDGTNWGNEASFSICYAPPSVVSDGTYVHIAAPSYSNSFYFRVTPSTGVTSDSVTLHNTPSGNWATPSLTIDKGTGEFYAFWADAPDASNGDTNHLYYKKKNSSGTWSSAVDWVDESTDGIYDNAYDGGQIDSFYEVQNNKIGVAYASKEATPYNIRFIDLTTQVDIGLRVYDGTQIISVGCEPADASGTTPSSALRIRKDTTTYGIILDDSTAPSASKLRIRTGSGTRALRKY